MLIHLSADSTQPIYVQLFEEIRGRILRGQMTPGTALPSIRELAAQVSISPNTVVQTYRELEARGLIVSRPGLGTFVASEDGTRAERANVVREIALNALDVAQRNGISTPELIRALRDSTASVA